MPRLHKFDNFHQDATALVRGPRVSIRRETDTILPLPKGESKGQGKGDARTTHALRMGFSVRRCPEGLMALSHSPFQTSPLPEVADKSD
jgi:hypothetical protein